MLIPLAIHIVVSLLWWFYAPVSIVLRFYEQNILEHVYLLFSVNP